MVHYCYTIRRYKIWAADRVVSWTANEDRRTHRAVFWCSRHEVPDWQEKILRREISICVFRQVYLGLSI